MDFSSHSTECGSEIAPQALAIACVNDFNGTGDATPRFPAAPLSISVSIWD